MEPLPEEDIKFTEKKIILEYGKSKSVSRWQFGFPEIRVSGAWLLTGEGTPHTTQFDHDSEL